MLKLALIDDYAGVALQSADWSRLDGKAEITVFDKHLNEDEAARELAPFDMICTIRERMAFPRTLLERLPNLQAHHHRRHAADQPRSRRGQRAWDRRRPLRPRRRWTQHRRGDAGAELGPASSPPSRHLAAQDRRMRAGLWQSEVGTILAGKTLGLLGLGRIGKRMARYGKAFDMEVIAWSQNLTAEAAAAEDVRRVEKDALFAGADVVSIHLVLSDRTRGLVTSRELGLMKPTAHLVNTSRGPIVVEQDLIAALRDGTIAGAGLDVFDREPPPADHPFHSMENVTLTPHLGYATHETLAAFYADSLEAIVAFADGNPTRVSNPEALARVRP